VHCRHLQPEISHCAMVAAWRGPPACNSVLRHHDLETPGRPVCQPLLEIVGGGGDQVGGIVDQSRAASLSVSTARLNACG
jgi:hypothetical protein